MGTTVEQARAILQEARSASGAGDVERAVECYERFFDHALDEDPASYYGVRLSYCLVEWANLGARNPMATDRLRMKGRSALASFDATREPERFHDYVAICDALSEPELAREAFLRYHESDSEAMAPVFHFIWRSLVGAQLWSVCGAYLSDHNDAYDRIVHRFDRGIAVCDQHPELGGQELVEDLQSFCVRDLRYLVMILRNTGRDSAATQLFEVAKRDPRLNRNPDAREAPWA